MNDFLQPIWEPHSYQLRGIDWLSTRPEAALFWAPGLGKTTTTLAADMRLRAQGYTGRMLVLAPLIVCRTTWSTEHLKWRQFAHLRIGFAHGRDKVKILLDPQYDIVVLNYDGIMWASPHIVKHQPFEKLVCDELTKVKHTSTQRFKRLRPCLPTFKFRWGLSGTPAANGLMDLFGQMFTLDQGFRLGRYITHFRSKYFHQKPYDRFGWHITQEKAEAIYEKVREVAMYVDPHEYLDLPELLHVTRPVYLDAILKRQYRQLETAFILKLQESVVTAANAAVLTSKLRQFTSGVVYDEAGVPITVHSAKLDALLELVEEMAGEPLLVAYNFSHELHRILESFPSALALHGGMTAAKVTEVMSAWNTGQHPLLLVQCDMAAHGLNLQFGGSALCWYSQTYNLEVFIQLIARLWRQGQRNNVRCYHLIAEGTIDQVVAETLAGKNATQDSLFAALNDLKNKL